MLSEQQKIVRSRGIGGSEIAEVCGLVPWSGAGPHRVWARKMGILDDAEETYAMRRGSVLGPYIAELYMGHTGRLVEKSGKDEETVVCQDEPIVIATPDGIIDGSEVLECKAPSFRTSSHWYGEFGEDRIPDYYIPQLQWEMRATGLDKAQLVGDMVTDLAIRESVFNSKLFAALLDRAKRFWEYVESGTPPPADGSDACIALMKSVGETTGEYVDGDRALFEDYIAVMRDKRAVEDREKAVKSKIMESIGDADGCISPLGKAHFKVESGRAQWKKIAEAMAGEDDLLLTRLRQYEQDMRSKPSRVLRVYPKKGV